MEPAVDMGGLRTVPVTQPRALAAQLAGPLMTDDPENRPQSVDLYPLQADPQRPTVEPQSVEALAGVTVEAAPAPLDPPTEKSRRAGWIGWVLTVTVVAITVAVFHATLGLTPIVISTAVLLVVTEIGITVLLLALTAAAIRHRLRLAVQQGRSQAQEEAWSRHQQFLRRLDHELKNPSTVVRATITSLPQAPLHELQARVNVVDAQTRRMRCLMTNSRKLASLETAVFLPEDVNITETVRDATQAVGEERTVYGGGPRTRLGLPQVPWPLSHMRSDSDLLYSAVYNVVSDASKYTLPGGTVEVRGREESGTVIIRVVDIGIEVSQTDLLAVWSELVRAGNAQGLLGLGLGLTLVSTIVRRHGGSVRMVSREGVRTRVWLSLPVAGPTDTP